jgi:hypothetical protein
VRVDFDRFCVAVSARIVAHCFRAAFVMDVIYREIRREQTRAAFFFPFELSPRSKGQCSIEPEIRDESGNRLAILRHLSCDREVLELIARRGLRTRPHRFHRDRRARGNLPGGVPGPVALKRRGAAHERSQCPVAREGGRAYREPPERESLRRQTARDRRESRKRHQPSRASAGGVGSSWPCTDMSGRVLPMALRRDHHHLSRSRSHDVGNPWLHRPMRPRHRRRWRNPGRKPAVCWIEAVRGVPPSVQYKCPGIEAKDFGSIVLLASQSVAA